MRPTYLLAAVACSVLFLAACGPAPSGAMTAIGAERGGWVVVNYWAEWCKPCIKEVPELNALDAREGVRVLGVNYDNATGEELASQLAKLAIAFATLPNDPAEELGLTRPQVLPTTVIIAPDGKVTATLVGPQSLTGLLALMGMVEQEG